MIYDYFRTTDSYHEIQGLSGLFNFRLENDDIQDFDLRWEQALSASDLPSDKILESLYFSKLQNSSQILTIMATYNQEILRGGGERDYHRLRMCVRSYIEQAQRSNNFRIQNEIAERGAVTKGKGQNSITERKTRKSSKCGWISLQAYHEKPLAQKEKGTCIPFGTEGDGIDWREKRRKSRGKSCDQSENSLFMGSEMQKIVVSFSASSRMS